MIYHKYLKTTIYILSGIIAAFAAILFWRVSTGYNRIFENFAEPVGTGLAVLIGFEIVLFFAIQALKHKLIPQAAKIVFTTTTKYLAQYHRCVGTLIVSVLLLHLGLTLDFANPWQGDLITGYVTVGFVMLSVLAGVCCKINKKALSLLHIIFAFMACAPFLLHVL